MLSAPPGCVSEKLGVGCGARRWAVRLRLRSVRDTSSQRTLLSAPLPVLHLQGHRRVLTRLMHAWACESAALGLASRTSCWDLRLTVTQTTRVAPPSPRRGWKWGAVPTRSPLGLSLPICGVGSSGVGFLSPGGWSSPNVG